MGESYCILIAEDDSFVLTFLRDALVRRYEVLTAVDGEEALRQLRIHEVDAIVADHMMPKVSGVELLRLAQQIRPNAARILVTASERMEDARDAINLARVHRFMLKPLRIAELESIVASAINESRLQSENEQLIRELRSMNENLEVTVRDRTRELEDALARISHQAVHDGLTGLFNHGFFQESLEKMIAAARRTGEHLGLLFIDVDHFKAYNDNCGHRAGDEVLKGVAEILETVGTREADTAARYGGEEFVVALTDTTRVGAVIAAERLRQQIEARVFPNEDLQPGGQLTVSIGVACFPDDAENKQQLIDAADRALYAAKDAGRNCVRSAHGEPMPSGVRGTG